MSDYDANLNPKNTPKVLIEWEDIHYGDRWNDDDEVQPVESLSLGWLLEETEAMIVVASSYAWREQHWGGLTAFSKIPPRVTRLTFLEDGEEAP